MRRDIAWIVERRPVWLRAAAAARWVMLCLAVATLGPGPLPSTSAAAAVTTTNAVEGPGGPNTAKSLETKLAEARAQLAAFGTEGSTNAPVGVSLQDVWTRRAVLRRLVRLLEQQLSNLEALEKARTRREEVTRQAQSWTRFTEPPPYSVLLTDRLREEIQTEKHNLQRGETALPALDQLLQENRRELSQSEGKVRHLNEQLESAREGGATAQLTWQRELQHLTGQTAAAGVGSLELERQLTQETLAESRARLGLLQRQLLIADAAATFTQEDLDQVIGRTERQREQLQRELIEAQTRRASASQAADAAREQSRQQPSPRSAELVSAREAQLDAVEAAIGVLRLMLEGTSLERTMWEMRFDLYHNPTVEKLRDSERRLDVATRRLELWLGPARQQLEVSASQIQLQDSALNSLTAESELRPLALERLEALREREQWLLRALRGVESLQRLTQRWAEGLRESEAKLPLAGRVQTLFSGTRSFLSGLWNFEVFTAEDTITVDGQKISGKRGVTIGKIVMAISILLVGIWLTGLAARVTERLFTKRLKMEPNQASLIRRWLRAFLLVCLAMFGLELVKIPLTVFAFAGGALAIGLGFGTQTLLKNFVSGLILLFERPFRVGDVLDVGGQKGAVTSIGLRASVLQLWDGTETLIPNSSLLESNVTNWTYSNRKVRFVVSVGVAYGSDPRRVIKALTEVAGRHGLVEKDPAPQVLFTEFGDSTLNFELRFWVDVTGANAGQVASDLRLMIAGSFEEAGLQIAFPQRDVHLDTTSPLRVEVVPPGDGGTPGPGTAERPNSAEKPDQLNI